MFKDKGIRRGIEVFVKNVSDPDIPGRKARVINIYPPPSSWLVVKYEDGNIDQVNEHQVTTMFEINRRGREI